MSEAFATTVAVTIPILALAAGTEARAVRERLRRPDEKWERAFAEHQEKHRVAPDAAGAEMVAFFTEMPKLPRSFLVERIVAIAGAIVWLAVFVLLTIVELKTLVWLGDGGTGADPGLATFAVDSIGASMIVLIAAPAAYLLVPLLMPLDLMPQGLKKALTPTVTDKRGRHLLREIARELEGTIERAAERVEQAAAQEPAGKAEPSTGSEAEPGADDPAEARAPEAAPAQA